MYASLAAFRALKEQNVAHGRAVILIEACGRVRPPDLPFYVDHLSTGSAARPRGVPRLGLRQLGPAVAHHFAARQSGRHLTVRVLTEGVHSGASSGIVPSSFRIVRQLCRGSKTKTAARSSCKPFYVHIPPERHRAGPGRAENPGRYVIERIAFRRRRQADGRREGRADPEP